MKHIMSNWNFIRWLRLGLGVAIAVQSIYAREMAMILMGVLFAGMAVFNIGCCAAGGCTIPVRKRSEPVKDIEYEEVV